MSKKKEFKSESKRLLDLMINSIYTNKEIFLRELISNSSDALDKLYYRSLTDKNVKVKKDKLEINIVLDKDNRTITISDNGCGMTSTELEENLGTIAKSGTRVFKDLVEDDKNSKKIDIIGQFGVGFYSAFMVASKISVTSLSVDGNEAYRWESEGVDGYTIEKSKKDSIGTDIIIYLKEDTEDNNYSEYLDEYTIKRLVKKYSDYITYPIKYNDEVLNSMIPIWKKNKKDVTDEDYNSFYTDKFYDYEKPLKVISTSVEGVVSYKALLFIPSHAPYDFYTKEYEKGLSLYANGVLIMEKCSDLLPDYFSFVKGVVDTEDLDLNISREMLQQTKTLQVIAKNIEDKIIKELKTMLDESREEYLTFYKAFGTQIKFGIYNNFGIDKEKLEDLVMFYSSKKKDLITLSEYVENLSKDQNVIYYASGNSEELIDKMPQTEQVKEKDYEILYLTDYVDEFCLTTLGKYKDYEFKNIQSDDLDLVSEDEKKKTDELNSKSIDMLNFMTDELEDVKEVRFTNKLKNHPVCLTSRGNISIEMEKVINAMPTDEEVHAEKILEINENHPIKEKLESLYNTDKDMFKKYTKVLYSEACLIEGLPIKDPTEFANLVSEMISK